MDCNCDVWLQLCANLRLGYMGRVMKGNPCTRSFRYICLCVQPGGREMSPGMGPGMSLGLDCSGVCWRRCFFSGGCGILHLLGCGRADIGVQRVREFAVALLGWQWQWPLISKWHCGDWRGTLQIQAGSRQERRPNFLSDGLFYPQRTAPHIT